MTQRRPRWENDEVYQGVGSGSWLLPSLTELEQLAEKPGWIAEQPENHLSPQLRTAVAAAGLRWLSDRVDSNGTYAVTLGCDRGESKREIRRKVWQIIGSVAESTSHVVEKHLPEGAEFAVLTGEPDRQFAGHGHTVRILVAGTG